MFCLRRPADVTEGFHPRPFDFEQRRVLFQPVATAYDRCWARALPSATENPLPKRRCLADTQRDPEEGSVRVTSTPPMRAATALYTAAPIAVAM